MSKCPLENSVATKLVSKTPINDIAVTVTLITMNQTLYTTGSTLQYFSILSY